MGNQPLRPEFLKGLGIILVVVGVFVLVWDAYAAYVDAGFQRDVPPLLSFGALAVYGIVTMAAGVLALVGEPSESK